MHKRDKGMKNNERSKLLRSVTAKLNVVLIEAHTYSLWLFLLIYPNTHKHTHTHVHTPIFHPEIRIKTLTIA